MKLNDRQIKLINYPSKGRDTYSDGNSLYLRVTSKYKIWSYQYRYGSRVLRYTIGRYPQVSLKEARKISFELKQKIYKNINPQIEKLQKRRALSRDFNYYLDLYIENYVKVNLKSYKSLRNIFNYYLVPKLGKTSLDQLEKPLVLNIIDNLVRTNRGVTANRVLQVLKTFIKWCCQRGYTTTNHVQSIEKPFKEKSRDRVLTIEEIRQIYKVTENLSLPLANFTRFLILSGQRLNEISNLKWSQIHDTYVEFPRDMMKNNRKVITPITGEMQRILQSIPKNGEFIFSSTYGLKPLNCFSKIKSKLIQTSNIQTWTFHDFRRSMATFLGDKGIEHKRILSVLNHSDYSVTAIYNRSLDFKNKLKTLGFWNNSILKHYPKIQTSKFRL